MSIAAIVTRGYGSYSDVTLLATRGYSATVEAVVSTPVTSEAVYLRFELDPLFVRLLKRG